MKQLRLWDHNQTVIIVRADCETQQWMLSLSAVMRRLLDLHGQHGTTVGPYDRFMWDSGTGTYSHK